MKISAPWFNYYREIKALFEGDPEVKVFYDDDEKTLKLYVDNGRKADALAKLLPEKKVFGNVEVKIVIVPSNKTQSTISLIADAFEGNSALADIHHVETPFGSFDYVVFKSKIVQYFNDDISDINGNRSTLYQEIARDVFENSGVCFCTEAVDEKVEIPLGEWP